MIKRKYGWVRELPDHRDFMYAPKRAKLPAFINLRAQDGPIEDQGALGSCTANALAGVLQFLEKKDGLDVVLLSRLFIYYDEREAEGTVGTDSGANLRDGIKVLASKGVCSEKIWPYKISKFKTKPTQKAYSDGLNHTISVYKKLNTLTDMKSCLASGYPFVFGFAVYESFESDVVAATGIVPMPSIDESQLGGHAVTAIGYDDNTKRFTVRNSWGTKWGQNGYFTIPYAYLTNRNLASDFWTISRAGGL